MINHLHIHRPTLINETWKSRGNNCLCPDMHTRCVHGTGGRVLQPSKACPPARTPATLDKYRLRLHHYIAQSQEQMRRKQLRGDADLLKRRSQNYWSKVEW